MHMCRNFPSIINMLIQEITVFWDVAPCRLGGGVGGGGGGGVGGAAGGGW
jgi:uncharacterized membrane protein